MNYKKGAMFGLDARIALAIFGALSVISGAALYSAIQDSKATALIAEMNEVSKAIESYMLDTGQDLPIHATVYFKTHELVENNDNVSGWKGPYLSFEIDGSYHLNHPVYGGYNIFVRSMNSAWGGTQGVDLNLPYDCAGIAMPCSTWVTLSGVPTDLINAIEEKIDGTVDYKNGNVRAYIKTDGGSNSIYLKGPVVMSKKAF